MEIKTFTKKDIALSLSKRKGLSVKESKESVDELFNIMRDFMTKDLPYFRIEISNFVVF